MLKNFQQGDLKELELIGTKKKSCHENKFSLKNGLKELEFMQKGGKLLK
jgi:hypothetical protein